MSKQIEERVVSMQFDNQRFEKNVQTSMSTLDKLKQKLNLSGASKGLESVQTASKKVDMSGLSNSVETVRSKFSALEVMAVTALANITNSAVNAGKRMVAALTVEPVSDGFSEYEMTLNAVQTTMAATGKTAQEVEVELKKLDEYADKTVYSTADMLNNLPKFTNAGVKLEDATKAMIGIANATALAGGDAGKASIAFYNLGQAIGTGYLTRMDYNSINNAGIATMEWKKQMVEAAIAQGTLTKVGEDAYKAGNKTLTLQQLFIDGLQEQWATTDVMMKVFGDYGDETTDIGKKSYAAAQDIKTFSQMMESLKATAGTGWKDTWQIIFGDLEKAKEFWTGLTNGISSIITRMADWRNNLLNMIFDISNPWKNIMSKLDDAGLGNVKKVIDTVGNATDKLEYFQNVVTKVWRGDYNNRGDNPDRYDLLAKAGYDHRVVQDLVNKGYGYKLTIEDIEESHKKFGLTMDKTSESTKEVTKSIGKLTDEQLKEAGLTETEISLYKALSKEADRLGISIEDLVKNMSEKDGRFLIIDSLKNAWEGISGIFTAMKQAFKDIFNPPGIGELAVKIYGVLTSLNKLSEKLRLTDKDTGKLNETGQKFVRVFKGMFAALDIVLTIVGGPLKIAFKILSQFLGAFGVSVLDVAAYVGDLITKFSKWVDKTLDLSGVFEKAVPHIKKAAKAIKEWFVAFKESKTFQVGKNIIQGLLNGISSGVKTVALKMLELGSTIIEKICGVLGIHSPSTEFFDIGSNIIAGLFNGISQGSSIIWDLITSLGSKIVDIIKEFNFQKLIGVTVGAGLGVALFKVLGIVKDITSPLREFGELIDSAQVVLDQTGDAIKRLSKAKAFELRSEAVLNFAKAIGILAASIALLAYLPKDKLWGAVAAMLVLVGVIVGLTVLVMKMSEKMADLKKADFDESISFGKMIGAILGLSVAMVIIATAIKKLSFLNKDNVGPVLLGVLAAIGTLVLLLLACKALSKISVGKGIDEVGPTLLKISLAMLLMATVIKIIGKMKPENMTKGLIGIGILSLIMVGLMAATKLFSKDATKIGSTLMAISGAITLLALVLVLLGTLKPEKVISGLLAISALSAIVVGLMIAVKYFAKGGTKIVGTLMGIAGAIGILAMVVVIMSMLKPEKMAIGMIAVGLLGGLIIGLLAAVKAVDGGGGVKIATSILGIAVAIGILAAVAVALSLIKIGGLVKGIIAVGLLSGLAVGLMYATKGAEKCEKSILAMSAAIAILAVAIAILSKLDIKGLAAGTTAMALVMGMLALMIKASGSANQAIGSLIVITTAMTLMATALIILAKMPVENTLGAALALSLTLTAMTGVLYALGKMGNVTGKALLGVIGLTLLAVPMLAFVGVLYLMQNIQNASTNVVLLAGLITVCAILLPILAICGAFWIPALIGIACLTAMAVPMLAFVGVLALMQNIQNATANVMLLITLMTTLTQILVVLAAIGPMAIIGVTALTMLSSLMVTLGVLAVAVGALMEKFPALQSFLDTGIPVLVQLAGGIGQMIGAFVGGIMTEIANTLPTIGTCLSQFMTNATVFIEGAKKVDSSVLAGIGILAGAIIALTAADLISSVASFLTGGSSFADLGTQLSQFMMNAMPFIAGASMLTPEMTTGVKNLAETILILTGANVLEGLTSWFTGGTSLASFGAELAAFGPSLKAFADSVAGIDGASVNAAADAAKTLAEMTATIPNEGGVAGWFAGENSIAKFASELPKLAEGLKGFADKVAGIDGESVKAAAEAGKALTEMTATIPNEGGVAGWFAGENSIAKFATEIIDLGKGLKGFSDQVTGINVESVTAAANAAKALAEMADTIPNEGGVASWFAGENSIATFAGNLTPLGKGLKSFSDSVVGISPDNVTAAANAAKALAEMADVAPKNTDKLKSFGSNLVTFGGKLKTYFDKVSNVSSSMIDTTNKIIESVNKFSSIKSDGISSAANAIDKIKKALDKMSKVKASVADGFSAAIKKLATTNVTALTTAFTNAESKIKKTGENIVNKLVEGLTSKQKSIETASKTLVSNSATTISGQASLFTSAGKDLGSGLIKGIEAKETAVYNAAYKLGQKAVQGEKDGQKSNSPSKLTIQAGKWFGEGLAIGIERMTRVVYNSAYGLGETATGTISTAVSKIADIVNSDIDAQPTIRPVLDLSDVRAGAGSINALFSGRTLAVDMAGVGSISASMRGYQNGKDSKEIVSGIKALRKDIANMPRNTYNIDGVTYDDGTNVSDAVGSLVRAINIDRRA